METEPALKTYTKVEKTANLGDLVENEAGPLEDADKNCEH